MTIRIAPAPDARLAVHQTEEQLAEALRTNFPPSDAQGLTLIAEENGTDLVGGLIGATSYGWLLVKALWVDLQMRGRGLGQDLMQFAECQAAERGCHSAWLDTSSEQAARFYERLGYRTFAMLENGPSLAPEGHRRWLMKRQISTPVSRSRG